MSSPLVKISDQSWSLSCLCCNCAQEVRDNFKMIIGPAFVEYNHRFTCPYCQTYNQILLSKPMFLQAPDMSATSQPPPPVEEVPSLNTILDNVGMLPQVTEPPRPKLPSFEAEAPKPPTVQQKRKSAFDEPEEDDVIDAGDLDLEMMSGKGAAAPSEPPAVQKPSIPTPSFSDVFPEATETKAAAPAVIKIAGKELPRTYVFAGGGLAVVLLAGIAFMFMGGGTQVPVQPAPQPAPQPVPKPAQPPKPQQAPPPQPSTQLVESKMVEIPAGEYLIGNNEGSNYEKPVHKVTLKAFSIDVREVTKEEYAKFLEATGRKPPESWEKGKYPGSGREPVTDVDWNDAFEYAKWAGKRLPTEQEWEVAASGKDHLLYPWGNEWKDGKANTKEMGTPGPQPAGVFPSQSPFGLFDTVGNVWEWTASEPTPYPGSNSKVADAGKYRVIRGGAWNEGLKTATTTGRNWIEKDVKSPALGFRCAKDMP